MKSHPSIVIDPEMLSESLSPEDLAFLASIIKVALDSEPNRAPAPNPGFDSNFRGN